RGAEEAELEIMRSGGVPSVAEAQARLADVDGVAIGRSAYQRPYLLADVDGQVFGEPEAPPTPRAVLEALIPYVERHLGAGGRINNVVRHILGLYHGVPGARAFRRHLSENAPRAAARLECRLEAHALIQHHPAHLER